MLCKEFGWGFVNKPSGYWNFERCKEEALKYKTKRRWKLNSGSSYQSASQNNWIDKCCEHMDNIQNPTGFWNIEKCKADALKHKTRYAWQKAKNSGYWAAKNNKWIDICCEHMVTVNKPEWTLKNCHAEANKYQKKSEWKVNSGSSYNAALRNNWFNDCIKHMKIHGNCNV